MLLYQNKKYLSITFSESFAFSKLSENAMDKFEFMFYNKNILKNEMLKF